MTQSGWRRFGTIPISEMPHSARDSLPIPIAAFIACGAIASLATAFLAYSLLAVAGVVSPEPPIPPTDALNILGSVLVGPAIETLLLLLIQRCLARFFGKWIAAGISAIVLASLHALVWWGWALIVTGPFLVFSIPCAVLRCARCAFRASWLIHAVHNLCLLLFS